MDGSASPWPLLRRWKWASGWGQGVSDSGTGRASSSFISTEFKIHSAHIHWAHVRGGICIDRSPKAVIRSGASLLDFWE